ncbi:cation diffusion facilitator family transporter [Archaeoglobus profundus]|uniref:Cation diffusion facilitator family transporter n=1 Tax=Archaeoglobus profundus (strain DSM 5631 / JCM 9629 / NBRC 100127 / Av18) TaxID=572546 RepID=D2RDA4_ARCPA|nr:cation diffusion facilitator family transporter [Archaeoglobus profundus]ADB58098.1 cation diffusion facilitator family transporter [Archaeoglobus profundus DSM 5631]
MRELRAGKISAIVNVFLTIIKVVAGILVNSTALIADGIHSLIDVFGSVLVWIGLKIANKPPDELHPYGHIKAESLVELAVGLIIVISALTIIHEAVISLMEKSIPDFEFYALIIALFSAIVNEVLARYKIKVGMETKSSSLVAEGKHSRVDVISSLSVFVGYIFVGLGYWWMDPLVAIVISVLILQMGFGILKNAVNSLMDKVDPELALKIRSIVEDIEGVEGVEFVGVRGTWKAKIVEVHISINPGMSAEIIDALEREIEERIRHAVSDVVRVVTVVKVKKQVVVAIPEDGSGNYTGELDSPYFTIANLSTNEIFRIENPHYGAERRKGYLIAELLSKYGVNVVVVRRIGEGAKSHLRSRGIFVRFEEGKSVEEILEKIANALSLKSS